MPFDAVSFAMGAKNSGGGGGGGGALVITDTDGTLNKTWQELYDSTVPMFVLKANNEDSVVYWYPVVQAAYDPEDGYWIAVLNDTNTVNYYVCDAATDYPVLENTH